MGETDYLLIGKLVGAHGVKGAVKIVSYAESETIFAPDSRLELIHPDGRRETIIIDWIRPQKRVLLMGISGVTDRSQAEALIGSTLHVQKASLPEPGEGVFYWADLIGLSVFSVEGDFLGTIASLFPTGGNDILVVTDGEKEILIPAIEPFIRSVDIEHRRMTVDLPEGLV